LANKFLHDFARLACLLDCVSVDCLFALVRL